MRKRGRKFRDEEARKKWEDIMTTKRRKVFTSIAKKEVGKQHRAKMNKHKELLILCKRVALQCQKAARQKAVGVDTLVHTECLYVHFYFFIQFYINIYFFKDFLMIFLVISIHHYNFTICLG